MGRGLSSQSTRQALAYLVAKLLRLDLGSRLGKGIAIRCMHVPSLFCFQPWLVRTILGDQQHVEAGLGVEGDPVGGSMKGYPLQGPGVVQLHGIWHLADVQAAWSVPAISGDEALPSTSLNRLRHERISAPKCHDDEVLLGLVTMANIVDVPSTCCRYCFGSHAKCMPELVYKHASIHSSKPTE